MLNMVFIINWNTNIKEIKKKRIMKNLENLVCDGCPQNLLQSLLSISEKWLPLMRPRNFFYSPLKIRVSYPFFHFIYLFIFDMLALQPQNSSATTLASMIECWISLLRCFSAATLGMLVFGLWCCSNPIVLEFQLWHRNPNFSFFFFFLHFYSFTCFTHDNTNKLKSKKNPLKIKYPKITKNMIN